VTPSIDLVIEAGDWPDEDTLTIWFNAAIGAATSVTDFNLVHGEISVVLTDDPAMQAINREQRGKDKPTNVLSFPGLTPEALAKLNGKRPFLLGDLVFALQTIEREAEAGHISLHAHMSHLIVHGFLHLLGYDHEEDPQAEVMEALETRILSELGIADPYRDGAKTTV
jgi:probable rRNA maturation factor